METLYSKIEKLHDLWISLGSPTDSETVNRKLQHVLFELDRVLENEQLEKRLLTADIEDILASIERRCQILGSSVEHLLQSDLCKGITLSDILPYLPPHVSPSFARQESLLLLDSRLAQEVRERRAAVKEWLTQIAQLSAELGQPNPFKSFEEYKDELSWGTVQSISCTLRDLLRIQDERRQMFEIHARAIHYYWKVMRLSPNQNDSLEVALDALFQKVPYTVIKRRFKKPSMKFRDHEELVYYNAAAESKPRLPLSSDCISALISKTRELETLFNRRLTRFNKYTKSIQTIWEELKVPQNKRRTIRYLLDDSTLNELEAEFDKLKDIVRVMAEEYIDKFREKLEDLWDKALLTQDERAAFITRLHEKACTMDQVHLYVDEHIKYLKRLQPKAKQLDSLMKRRRDLIQKMVDFEKTASDPRRLFRASFQLNEEEKFRRTCFPTLLQLDESLLKAIQDFERASGKPFMLGNRRYRDTLLDEIADRTANKTFFGFLNADPVMGDAAVQTATPIATTSTPVRSRSCLSSSTSTPSPNRSTSRTKKAPKSSDEPPSPNPSTSRTKSSDKLSKPSCPNPSTSRTKRNK